MNLSLRKLTKHSKHVTLLCKDLSKVKVKPILDNLYRFKTKECILSHIDFSTIQFLQAKMRSTIISDSKLETILNNSKLTNIVINDSEVDLTSFNSNWNH